MIANSDLFLPAEREENKSILAGNMIGFRA
jgi:hypothetical protein